MADSIALGRGDSPPVFLDTRGDHHPQNGTLFGFWLYLLSDLMIFACMFATFGVLSRSFGGGPGPRELFELPLVALNTGILLVSSITYGMAMVCMQHRRLRGVLGWLLATGVLGLAFLGVELYEFSHLVHIGAGPQRSAFLSAFFALVGTHGLHVLFGVVWLVVLLQQLRRHGITPANARRVACLSLFWHFLDVVWIGVFSFVYLMGVLP